MDQNREWMYRRLDGKYLSMIFIAKVDEFIAFACRQEEFQRCQKLKCPCMKCRSKPYCDVDTIKLHLYQRGFQSNYYRWIHHGEPFPDEEGACASSSTWMTDDIRRGLKRMRETDEEFKKRSQRYKRNKVEGPKAKISHSQGSISSAMWFNKLAKAFKRRPSASELFAATHSKVDDTGRRIWCDEHARSVYEKYEQLKAGKDVQVSSEADDNIFYEACGGWCSKGNIYGLDREGPSLFPRPARSRGSTAAAASSYSSPLVTQLQDQLQSTQNELQTTQARLHATEEELRTTKEQLDTAKKQLEDQRVGLLELHARFDSFSALLGHPTTRGGNSLDSS